MKKPTIAVLQKQVEELQRQRDEAHTRIGVLQEKRDELERSLRQLHSEHRDDRHSLEKEMDTLRAARAEAESVYDRHRSAVLHYFMALSNPALASDQAAMADLLAQITGLMPRREARPPKQPWEL